MDSSILLSVACLINNDEKTIKSFIDEVITILEKNYKHYELLLIDNGSTDKSVEIVKSILKETNNIRLVVLSKSYNEQIAYTAALENVIGDYVVLMELNDDPPKLIPELVKLAFNGSDIVIGKKNHRTNEGFISKIVSLFLDKINQFFTGYKIDAKLSHFMCISRRVVSYTIQNKDRNKYLNYFNLQTGFPKTFINYDIINRSGGRKKLRFFSKVDTSLSIIISNSNKLIRFAGAVSFLACIINLLYMGYVFVLYILRNNLAEGWTSISFLSSFMFSIVLLVLSIICAYISYIVGQIKTGPLYFVSDDKNSSVVLNQKNEKNVT
jgi:glycosyltransferase involved in cell wall biosynthesis